MKDQPGIPEAAYASYKKEQDNLTDDLRKQALQAYYASISFMDAQVGAVVDAVDRWALLRRPSSSSTAITAITSAITACGKSKASGSAAPRVPLIISVPGTSEKGKACARTVELVDLHATLADLCGIEAPKTDGESLKPLLDKVDSEWSHAAYSQVLRGQQLGTNAPKFKDQQKKEKGKGKEAGFMGRSVRNEQFRYIEWGEGGVAWQAALRPDHRSSGSHQPGRRSQARRNAEADAGAAEEVSSPFGL